jgi:hypothetical protein
MLPSFRDPSAHAKEDRVRGQIQYAATLRDLGRIDDALRAITPLRQHNPHAPAPAA